jgi:hypothetical protein
MTDTRHLVIVGGGTAGWMTAASLAQALPRGSWTITLVESSEIGIIGVGEGSFPTLRNTIARLGQGLPGGDERSFMRAARATFKQGVRFVGWAGQPTPGSQSDDYFHPFDLPRDNFDERLLPCWLDSGVDPRRPSWAGSISVQEAVIHAGRAPKRAQDADFTGPLNYAYHFDATSLAAWLRQMAQARGVQRIETTIASARLTPEGQIAAILPKDGSPEITGDFFIDCSGLSAMLIGDALGSPFVPVSDVLMNDRAVALQIPDAEPGQPIAPTRWRLRMMRAGSGISLCPTGAAPAASIPAPICPTTRLKRPSAAMPGLRGKALHTAPAVPHRLSRAAMDRQLRRRGPCRRLLRAAGIHRHHADRGGRASAGPDAGRALRSRRDGGQRAQLQPADDRPFRRDHRLPEAALLHQPPPRHAILARQHRSVLMERQPARPDRAMASPRALALRFRGGS